ncbi:hypothetical protein ACFFLZ_16010 [Photobacterium aphoticum]|nr:hypothetical protein [Photobacterium aphoticum]
MMISLIIAPVFAMPAHHSLGMMMPATPVTATAPMDSHHAMPDMSQASHASTQTTSHCSDTVMSSNVMSDDASCADMDSMDNCQHCNGQHCQYSTLTTLFTALTDHFQHPQPATWLTDALLTRQERALRPPIHA